MKSIIGHGGYFACDRCEVEGGRNENRVIDTTTNAVSRTDDSFGSLRNLPYHNEISLLIYIEAKIDIIRDFPLDSMHLSDLSVMKKLLNDYWSVGLPKDKLSGSF